jgi:hypothetical protein
VHTDVTFHPLVYYHTGVPGPNGRMSSTVAQAHRRLEALIDLHFVGSLRGLDDYSLAGYVADAAGCVRDLSWIAARALVNPGEQAALVATLEASWARYALGQGLFRRCTLAGVAYSLRRLLPDGGREIVALAYAPQLRTLLARVTGEVEYRHPVTGVAARVPLAALRRAAAAAAAATLVRLEAATSIEEPLAGEVGPTLEAGLPGVGAGAMVHHAPTPLVPL